MSRYCPTAAQHGGGQEGDALVLKTYTYKKITKPLLERKRRARINACLDELKDIMTVGIKLVKVVTNSDLIVTGRLASRGRECVKTGKG